MHTYKTRNMSFIFGLSLLFVIALTRAQFSAMDQRWMKIYQEGNHTFSPLLVAVIIDNQHDTPVKRSVIAPSTTTTTYKRTKKTTTLKSKTLKPTTQKLTTQNATTQKPKPPKTTTMKPIIYKTTNPFLEYAQLYKKQYFNKLTNSINGKPHNKTIIHNIPTHTESTTKPTVGGTIYTISTSTNETKTRSTDYGTPYTRPKQNQTTYTARLQNGRYESNILAYTKYQKRTYHTYHTTYIPTNHIQSTSTKPEQDQHTTKHHTQHTMEQHTKYRHNITTE